MCGLQYKELEALSTFFSFFFATFVVWDFVPFVKGGGIIYNFALCLLHGLDFRWSRLVKMFLCASFHLVDAPYPPASSLVVWSFPMFFLLILILKMQYKSHNKNSFLLIMIEILTVKKIMI